MACCCPTMKFQRPFGLNRKVVSDSGRVSSFWGAEVVKANHLKAQSGPQKIQTRLIRSVLTPSVDQESHVCFHTFATVHEKTYWEVSLLCWTLYYLISVYDAPRVTLYSVDLVYVLLGNELKFMATMKLYWWICIRLHLITSIFCLVLAGMWFGLCWKWLVLLLRIAVSKCRILDLIKAGGYCVWLI